MYDGANRTPSRGETIEAVIEIPRRARNKYEYDDKRDIIRLDRALYSSVHYPTDYGFIPETLAGDGYHLVIIVRPREGCDAFLYEIEMIGETDAHPICRPALPLSALL